MKKRITVIVVSIAVVLFSAIIVFILLNDDGLKSGDIIIGIGDSITAAGKTNDEFSADETSYLADLGDGYFKIVAEELLEDIGDLTFYNSARSGITARGFVPLVNPYCLDYNPNIIVITLGINDFLFDTPAALQDGFFHITDAIYKKGVNTVVVLPFIMDHYQDYGHMEHPPLPEDLTDYYDIVVELSEGYGFTTIDIGAIFDEHIANGTDPKDLSEDGIHPTDLGAEILAEAVLLAIDNF